MKKKYAIIINIFILVSSSISVKLGFSSPKNIKKFGSRLISLELI
jgi:hypothetical protein